MARRQTREEVVADSLIITAPTLEDALDRAAGQLDRPVDEIECEILDEGSGGLFGLGARPARIKVLAPDLARQKESARLGTEVLQELLEKLGIQGRVRSYESPMETGMTNTLEISSPDASLLIGRRGETLRDLEYMVRLIASRRLQRWPLIHVDVDGYRARRWRHLRTLATEAAEKVRFSGQPVPLPPMPAWERRIIHQSLQSDPDVTTQSEGREAQRHVVVWPQDRSRRSEQERRQR